MSETNPFEPSSTRVAYAVTAVGSLAFAAYLVWRWFGNDANRSSDVLLTAIDCTTLLTYGVLGLLAAAYPFLFASGTEVGSRPLRLTRNVLLLAVGLGWRSLNTMQHPNFGFAADNISIWVGRIMIGVISAFFVIVIAQILTHTFKLFREKK